MADGQLDNINVCFIIQARMGSSRLPGKVLLPIPLGTGKPLLQWIVDELKKTTFIKNIIVASSISPDNDVLENYCRVNSINVFRGDENDVLSRFIEIVKREQPNVVVRLTGDNPIIDISLLEKAIAHHVNSQNDYTKTKGLPVGMNLEIISPLALTDLQKIETTKDDKEHVTLYFNNTDLYKKEEINLTEDVNLAKLRLTVDYASDFLVLSQLLEISQATNIVGLALVQRVFEQYPWVFQVNLNNIQNKPPADLSEELEIAIRVLDEIELLNASFVLKKP
jgi:spore coat polysaccharide biosynthesis protein SpsF